MAKTALLPAASVALTKCGRPVAPKGQACVDLYKLYYYQKQFLITGTAPPYPPDTNEQVEIAADTIFTLQAISGLSFLGPASSELLLGLMYVQIQFPSGRFQQNLLADLIPDAGYGSGRLVFPEEIICPPGSHIFITLDASIARYSWTGAQPPFTVLLAFEGSLRYYVPGNALVRSVKDSAGALPRYFGATPNQNAIAPEWFGSGLDGVQCHEETPRGLEDDAFTYSNGITPAVFSEAAPVAQTITITIESTSDFLCRRILFTQSVGDVAPTFYGRIRTSLGGSSFCNDYIPLNNMRVFRDWNLKRGLTVYIDVFGTTNGGDGNTTLYVWLQGCKRRAEGQA